VAASAAQLPAVECCLYFSLIHHLTLRVLRLSHSYDYSRAWAARDCFLLVWAIRSPLKVASTFSHSAL